MRRPHQIPKEDRLAVRKKLLALLEGAGEQGITMHVAIELVEECTSNKVSSIVLGTSELIELKKRRYVLCLEDLTSSANNRYVLTPKYYEDKQRAEAGKEI